MVTKPQVVTMTGEELRAHRLSTNLSQVTLASMLGIHWNTYSRAERSEAVEPRTAVAALLVVAAWHAHKRGRLAPEFGRLLPGVVEEFERRA